MDRRRPRSTTPARCSTSATAIADDVHEVERALDLAARRGVRAAARRRRRAADPAPPVGAPLRRRPYVVVHPGASVPARAWAPERNARARRRARAAGRRVVVTGGAGRAGAHRRSSPARPGIDLGGRTTLRRAGRRRSPARDAIVVGNTGPAHLAAAVGTPVVSLFAPTVPPVRWRPWRVPHELLCVDVPCAGCRARVCPVAGPPVPGAASTRRGRGRAVDRLAAPPPGGGPREDPALARPRRLDDRLRPRATTSTSVPVVPDRGPDGRGRARTYDWPDAVAELAPERARATRTFDVVVLQRPHELEHLAEAGGRRPGRDVPAIYVEHNAPQGRIAEMRHPVADRDDLLARPRHPLQRALLGRGRRRRRG